MKLILYYVGLILLTSIPAEAQPRTLFDVKTKFAEKTDLAPAKAGSMLLLARSDWAGVTEVGETYSLWLKNYRRAKEGEKVHVKLDLEIRTPSMVRSGKLLASESVDVLYDPEEVPIANSGFWVEFRKHVKNTSRDMENEGISVGKKVVETARLMMHAIKR